MREMNFTEMQETNGGIVVIVTLGLIAVGLVAVNEICETIESVREN